ncbi:hypothetical protein [Rhizobium sp.]
MADFVAVIRRAVDGLTDNTPEMRVKVYEKARSAVVRQLENMNPRPPEAMFKRQLDKLDDAIRQVEEEHGEALPPETVAAEPAPVEIAQPVQQPVVEPVARSAEPVEAALASEPVTHKFDAEPAYRAPVQEQPVAYQAAEESVSHAEVAAQPEETARQVAYEAPVAHVEPEPEVYQQPAYAAYAEPAHHEQPVQDSAYEQVEQPVAYHAGPEPVHPLETEVRYEEPAATARAAAEQDDPLLSHFNEPREPSIRHAANRVMEEPRFEPESEVPGMLPEPTQVYAQPYAPQEQPAERPVAAMPDWGVDIDREPEVAPAARTDDPAPQMPRAALTETDVATGFSDFVRQEIASPVVKAPPSRKEPEGDFSWDAPFDDLPDLPKPVAFEQALHQRQEEMARAPETKSERMRTDARAELEDLIGYKPAEDASRDAAGDKFSPEVTRGMSKLEGKSFKVNRRAKQKFNPLPIAFGVIAALVLAGGAFAAYTYRDDVTKLVASYMPAEATSTKTESETRDVAAVTTEAEQQTKGVTVNTDDAANATPASTEDGKPTEVASLDPSIVPSKFTQRLLANGSETETDAAKIPVDQSLTEGKTIAGQTVAASETEVAANNTAPITTADDATAKTEGLTAAQKMILYEERLGDSPVAVQGKVTWKLKNDTTATNGKEQPMVEATIEVPERKLKAVVSFKRNSDASLPASHIIEIVFDLPADFAEGNVESVQRVAFKQTEQDRGNSLIAVPAKITDDFHMIALNDDADARKVNTELMKTRSWIDIPVVYRNNRRALLTFEKGSTGTEAFDKALAAWSALGPTATND